MTSALTPSIALGYLRALSTDVRAAVALDAAGERVAGDPSIVAAARALVSAMAHETGPVAAATELALRLPAGVALAVRAPALAIVVAAGPQALVPLLLHDLRTARDDLGDAPHASRGRRWTKSDAGADRAIEAAHALLAAAGRND
ncbi:MAG: hypothetical protein JWQ48_717 [Conexibacter sp.]|nr:hypothetical protein [Conexibacter sp.]